MDIHVVIRCEFWRGSFCSLYSTRTGRTQTDRAVFGPNISRWPRMLKPLQIDHIIPMSLFPSCHF